VYFFTLCPSIGPKERSRQALDRLPLVSNFLTNFWMEHFDGARLLPNSFRNAVWHALNEPACQYLQTRNPLCSTVYIFTHAAFDSQLPRCGNAQHRQMQVTGSVQIAGRSMLFSTVAGMCVLYNFFYWASSTIEQLKDAIRQEIQAVNIDTLGKVFQNLQKRIQVCFDVKGDQFPHRL